MSTSHSGGVIWVGAREREEACTVYTCVRVPLICGTNIFLPQARANYVRVWRLVNEVFQVE